MTNQIVILDREAKQNLHFRVFDDDKCTYYSLESRPMQEAWNIVGLHFDEDNPEIVSIRLLHFDEDELAIDTFDAVKDSNTYIEVTVKGYQALISLLEKLLQSGPVIQDKVFQHFIPLSRAELLTFGVHPQYVDRVLDNYYWYLSGAQPDTQERRSIICFPGWHRHYVGVLSFSTFPTQEILKPVFDLVQTFPIEGELLTFGAQSMQEFILLLKKHLPK